MTLHPIRILLVDDHVVVRTGFRRLLEQVPEFAVIAEAASGEEAYRLLASTTVDVAVMDLSMPGLSGIEIVRRIRLRGTRVRLLVFSVHESLGVVQRALEAGADGYLSKSSAADEMIVAVRAVARGQRYLGADIARVLASTVTGPRQARGLALLTQRECEVLRLFSSGRITAEVAAALSVSPKTVANNLSMIKQKVGAKSHAGMMRFAIENGLLDAELDQPEPARERFPS